MKTSIARGNGRETQVLPFISETEQEYERGVIFLLRLIGAKGPGLFLFVPIADKFIKIEMRTVAFDV